MVDEKPVLSFGDLLFPRIFQAFRMAIQPAKLAIAFAAVTIICLTGWVMDLSRPVVTGTYMVASARAGSTALHENHSVTELDIYMLPEASLRNFVESRPAGNRTGVFSTLSRFGAKEFHAAVYGILSLKISNVARSIIDCINALTWAFRWHPLYSIIFFAVVSVVLSIAGGAICRITALQFSRAEKASPWEAVHFARRRLVSLLGGLLGPGLLAFVFGLPIVLLGFVGNVPKIGELLTGLFLLLAFIVACAITITLVGAVAGLGLTSPAVAYEDSDSFDAVNHSFCYVYSKPWHMGFYMIVALVYGAVCYLFVRLFGFLLLWTTYRFLEIGFLGGNAKLHAIWPEPTFASFLEAPGTVPGTWSVGLAASLVRLWVLAVVGLMASFVISFYFSANTIIYALMRHRVDRTPLAEVYTSPQETAASSLSFGAETEAAAAPPATELNGGSGQGLKTSG